jgi:Zn-dependent protease
MKWSFRIAQIAGIDIKIHLTFFLIVVLGAIAGGTSYGAVGAAFGAVLILLLFLCVTLHELGHGIAARAFGIPVREIILLPLGGLALLGRNPSKAWHELVIAAAGPLVNVFIAAVLLLVTGTALAFGIFDPATLEIGRGAFPAPSIPGLTLWLLQANILLVLFNMIPAFPLDGGRILRSALAMVIGFRRATRIATFLGQGIAIVMGILGILSGNFLLALVAVFIFLGAGQENAEGQARTMLDTMRVGDAYNRHALTLNIGDRVSKVVDYILTSYQPDFAVMQNNRLIGIVTREDVLRALASDTRDLYVTGIMQREFVRVPSSATLDEVRQVMSAQGTRVVAVYEGEIYLGLISVEDISEAYAVLSYLERQQEARRIQTAHDTSGGA